uniref:Uncharacterized protein n=1 Tax=Glossina pallidipes TaxID=7398 RepID=A0A1B0A0Q6_GLOPL
MNFLENRRRAVANDYNQQQVFYYALGSFSRWCLEILGTRNKQKKLMIFAISPSRAVSVPSCFCIIVIFSANVTQLLNAITYGSCLEAISRVQQRRRTLTSGKNMCNNNTLGHGCNIHVNLYGNRKKVLVYKTSFMGGCPENGLV